jgi:hypothetical protein
MIRFIAFTWGLGAAWVWLLFAQKGTVANVLGAIVLGSVTVGLFVFMIRRSNRLNAGHEYVNARLEYHQGFSKGRWKRSKPARGDDGGSELTLGGW